MVGGFRRPRPGRGEEKDKGPAGGRGGAGSLDPSDPSCWRALKRGDIVGVSDEEAFAAAVADEGNSGGSIEYAVGEIRSFDLVGKEPLPGGAGNRRERPAPRAGAGIGTITFAELFPGAAPAPGEGGSGRGPLYLAIADLPERFELRLLFIPSGLEGGSRDEWIDRGDSWLFLPPPDPEDFLSKDLEYAPYPDVPPIDGRKLLFARSGPGLLYAEARDTGAPTIFAEYEAEGAGAPVANPLLVVVEEGWMLRDGNEPEEGGFVTAVLGRRLKPEELELWPT